MKEFFNKTVERAGMTQQQKAVLRFMALWKCRYKVWPALGEKGQKRFNLEREGEDRQVHVHLYISGCLCVLCVDW